MEETYQSCHQFTASNRFGTTPFKSEFHAKYGCKSCDFWVYISNMEWQGEKVKLPVYDELCAWLPEDLVRSWLFNCRHDQGGKPISPELKAVSKLRGSCAFRRMKAGDTRRSSSEIWQQRQPKLHCKTGQFHSDCHPICWREVLDATNGKLDCFSQSSSWATCLSSKVRPAVFDIFVSTDLSSLPFSWESVLLSELVQYIKSL